MELIDRYIYAVTRRLPLNQREDIEKELRGLIEDMLAGRSGGVGPTKRDIEAVLIELGEPSLLADKYRGTKRFLIGPEVFDQYLLVLKIVMAALAFGLTVALAIGYAVNPPQSLLEAVGRYFATLLAAAAQGFAWVTAFFAMFEYFGVEISKPSRGHRWVPAQLPKIPEKNVVIKPVEPIVGIVFTVLAIILFNFAHHLIGIYFTGEGAGLVVIPLFSSEGFRQILPFFNLLFAIGLVKDSAKLVLGKWTPGLGGINAVLNGVSLVVVIAILTNTGIWNRDFFNFFLDQGVLPAGMDFEVIWGYFTKGLIAVITFALIVDTITNLVKGFKNKVSSMF